MLLEFLVWFEHACQWAKTQWEIQKQFLRKWIGPAPRDYYLLSNGDILPVNIKLPQHIQSYLYFNNETNSIQDPTKESRLVRLPWLSLTHTCDGITTDLTDVVSELRHSRDCEPTLLQTVRLAALLRNEYLTESNATLHLTNNMGEDEVYEYKNTTTLEKI
jgi:hypothetical protein